MKSSKQMGFSLVVGSAPLISRAWKIRATCNAGEPSTVTSRPSRREVLGNGALLALSVLLSDPRQCNASTEVYIVPPLPYSYRALEPHIDAATMKLHHDKHFAAYTAKLNDALSKLSGDVPSTEEGLIKLLGKLKTVRDEKLRAQLRNNGGGYLNHRCFFDNMQGSGKTLPQGALAEALKKDFGSVEEFMKQFEDSAAKLFGSGFVYLVQDPKAKKMKIVQCPNQDHPAMTNDGSVALLGCDVWEHAYYLKYNNRRPDYVKAWWNVVNWRNVEKIYGGLA